MTKNVLSASFQSSSFKALSAYRKDLNGEAGWLKRRLALRRLRREVTTFDLWLRDGVDDLRAIEEQYLLFFRQSLPLFGLMNDQEIERVFSSKQAEDNREAVAICRRSLALGRLLVTRQCAIDPLWRVSSFLRGVARPILLIAVTALAGQIVASRFQRAEFVHHARFEARTAGLLEGAKAAALLQGDAKITLGALLSDELRGQEITTEQLRLASDIQDRVAALKVSAAVFEEAEETIQVASSLEEDLENYLSCLDRYRVSPSRRGIDETCFSKHTEVGDFQNLVDSHVHALRELYRQEASR